MVIAYISWDGAARRWVSFQLVGPGDAVGLLLACWQHVAEAQLFIRWIRSTYLGRSTVSVWSPLSQEPGQYVGNR